MFRLYGIGRDDVDYVPDTFQIVKRKDEAEFGECRNNRTNKWVILICLESDPENEGTALLSGYGVEPNVCIGLTVISLDSACRLIAGWNGVDASSTRPLVERLLRDSGIID